MPAGCLQYMSLAAAAARLQAEEQHTTQRGPRPCWLGMALMEADSLAHVPAVDATCNHIKHVITTIENNKIQQAACTPDGHARSCRNTFMTSHCFSQTSATDWVGQCRMAIPVRSGSDALRLHHGGSLTHPQVQFP